jgi:hypothetical protein
VVNGQWAIDNGERATGNGQWAIDNRQWGKGNGEFLSSIHSLQKSLPISIYFMLVFIFNSLIHINHSPFTIINYQLYEQNRAYFKKRIYHKG